MNKLLVISLMLLTLTACSDPRKEVLPTDLSGESLNKFGEKIKDLPEDDKKLLAGYMMRAEMSKTFGNEKVPVGITVQQAIDNQKSWVAKNEAEEKAQKAKAEKMKAEADAKKQEAKNALAVTVYDKQIIQGDFDKSIVLRIDFQNKTNKTITAVKGIINFKDKFGDPVNSMNFSETNLVIAPHQSEKRDLGRHLNEFMNDDKVFADTSLNDLTYEFIPDQILFDDGSKIVMPKI
jgi:hypothetical protein